MAISLQALSVSGTGRKKRDPRIAEIRSMYGKATQDVMAGKEIERMKREEDFAKTSQAQNYSLGLQRNALELQQIKNSERAGQMGMGIQIANLGLGAGKTLAGKTLSSVPYIGSVPGIGGIDLGASLGSGLIGAGVGQVLGGKSKLSRSLVGAGVGGLAGYLMSPGATLGASFGDILGGGFLGALGGFF